MTAERRIRPYNWDRLSPEVQAFVDREMTKVRPAEDLDPEHCRRLAVLLGLRQDGASDLRDVGGGSR